MFEGCNGAFDEVANDVDVGTHHVLTGRFSFFLGIIRYDVGVIFPTDGLARQGGKGSTNTVTIANIRLVDSFVGGRIGAEDVGEVLCVRPIRGSEPLLPTLA